MGFEFQWHALDSSPSLTVGLPTPGMDVADKGYQAGVGALGELSFRRKGLAVSLLFILFLALLVYLKIRQIEGRQVT